jgi:hypothetical protein
VARQGSGGGGGGGSQGQDVGVVEWGVRIQQVEGGADWESGAHKDKGGHEAPPLLQPRLYRLHSNDRRRFSYPVFTARASVCRQHALHHMPSLGARLHAMCPR